MKPVEFAFKYRQCQGYLGQGYENHNKKNDKKRVTVPVYFQKQRSDPINIKNEKRYDNFGNQAT